jgi:hypothetical protein
MIPSARAILLQADTYAELSDIVRLEVVERFGGVYVDTDFEALQVQLVYILSITLVWISLVYASTDFEALQVRLVYTLNVRRCTHIHTHTWRWAVPREHTLVRGPPC